MKNIEKNELENILNELLVKIKDCDNGEDLEILHNGKAEIYKKLKKSTCEHILCFKEADIDFIKNGVTKIHDKYEGEKTLDVINSLKGYEVVRAYAEYNKEYRQPIPYCVVKFENKYFAALRQEKSGEMRLINKIGFLGGHVTYDSEKDNTMMILNSLFRELYEEARIDTFKMKSVNLIGIMKFCDGVEKDHLALVFIVEINTDDIKTMEENVLKGKWFTLDELKREDNIENWSKSVIERLF